MMEYLQEPLTGMHIITAYAIYLICRGLNHLHKECQN